LVPTTPTVPPCREAAGSLVTVQGGDGARHDPGWYDQDGEYVELRPGDRLLVACEGGPSASRLERFPPRLEIEEADGTYVLVDDGPRASWRYVFVPRRP
jgi:hypothetical protein